MSISKNSSSPSLGAADCDQLVGQCVVVRIGGRNREAHGVAHGRALGHRPGVRVSLRSRGRRSRQRTPRPAPGSPISHPPLGVRLADPYIQHGPTGTCLHLPLRGYRSCRFDLLYYVPMEHIANHGVGSLGGVPRPRDPVMSPTGSVSVSGSVRVAVISVPTSGCSHCRVSSPVSSAFPTITVRAMSVLLAGRGALPGPLSVALTVIW